MRIKHLPIIQQTRIMETLTKGRAKLIRSLASRRGVKKTGMCLCEGDRACRELLAAAPDLVEFGVLREGAAIPSGFDEVELVATSPKEFESLSATVTPQDVMLVARVPEPGTGKPDAPFALVLDKISDPGNMGTILRSARAAGLKAVYIISGSTDPFGCKAIRSAVGAQFAMDIRYSATLADAERELRGFGFSGLAWRAVPKDGAALFDAEQLFDNSIIVIGGETSGVEELEGAENLTIPMPGGFESLNAAQAATVILFEFVRRID